MLVLLAGAAPRCAAPLTLRLSSVFLHAGTNYAVMKKAFEEGWGGVVAKTVSLDSSKVVNVTPR